MTPHDFIASLEHGEAKAAALAVYNLMTPVWIEITDDPATLPEVCTVVIIRKYTGNEWFGLRTVNNKWEPVWVESANMRWDKPVQTFQISGSPKASSPTHWRLI
jgi:hypothetical protein